MPELLHRFCVPCDQSHPGAQRIGAAWYRFKDIHCLDELLNEVSTAKQDRTASEQTLSSILEA